MSHSRPHVRALHWVAVWLLLGAFAPFAPAHAQADEAWVPGKGHGSISFAYQDLYVQYHTNWRGWRGKPGVIDNHALLLGFEYGLTDRLAVNVNLPYRNIRYRGSLHNDIEGDHDENTLDDGDYHSGWADVGLGLRYQWRDEPWAITPYVVFGTPMREYATYAHSAPGSGQSRLELGVNVGRAFGNLYLHGSLGYAFMEVVDDRRVDHAALTVGADYFVTPMLTARVGVTANKTFNGLDFPIDYPSFADEHFFHHDQNLRNDFVNVGVGLNYQLGDRYEVFANYGWSVWGENTHLVDNVATVGMARSF